MFRNPRRSRFLIAALCVAIVALRVGGLHVHLCMDGSEPPLSFHVADSGIHHLEEADSGGAHTDRDMTLASDVVMKKPSGTFDVSLVATLCALLLFLLSPARERFDFPETTPGVRSARTRLRPPLRGPPRLA